MDITFRTDEGTFNYRACAVIMDNNRLLAMRDNRYDYYYLPGGRVQLQETAETAVLRELKEELNIEAKIIRPLWVNQSYFTDEITNERYHEMCIYFLMDISKTDLLGRGDEFVLLEGERANRFEWIPLEKLKDTFLYPLFIKEEIFHLPEHLVLRTEVQ